MLSLKKKSWSGIDRPMSYIIAEIVIVNLPRFAGLVGSLYIPVLAQSKKSRQQLYSLQFEELGGI
jgi:hypothetical protein